MNINLLIPVIDKNKNVVLIDLDKLPQEDYMMNEEERTMDFSSIYVVLTKIIINSYFFFFLIL